MYKPNFCAECGARIERLRWRLWTSRRFCAMCDGQFRKAGIFLPLLVLSAFFWVGFGAGRGGRPAAPPLIIERREAPAHASLTEAGVAGVAQAGAENERADGRGKAAVEAGDAAAGAAATERPTDPHEIVSICGARTKKGTPCSRRVRGVGRCWQHRGLPAMLPQAKLVVPE